MEPVKASDYFEIEMAQKLWSIFNIHPDKIVVSHGSQPHLYHKGILLGYMDGRFGGHLWVNNPDYDYREERVDYPNHRQWHPVFNLNRMESCACRGPQCVNDLEEWKAPILQITSKNDKQKSQQD